MNSAAPPILQKIAPDGIIARDWALLALIIVAGIWGGGGAAYGINNLLVQIAALIALAFGRSAFFAFWTEAPVIARLLTAATIALPALQLVPLPPEVWQSLAGREMAIEAREAVGATKGWHPLTLDPGRTWTALLSLIVPLSVLSLGWSASKAQLQRLCWAAIGVALLGFIIGIGQVLSQGESGLFYPENPMPGVMFGTFANRNTAGLFLGIAMVLITAFPIDLRNKPTLAMKLLIFAVLLFGVILTRSRSAMALALIPCVIFAARLLPAFLAQKLRGSTLIIVGGLGLATAAFLAAQIPGSRVEVSFDRFAQGEDPRAAIWDDAQFSAQKYWPVGAGMGSFDEVFQADQSLENISAKKAGRAHNDFLEIAIEAGVFGIAIVAAWIAYAIWLPVSARKLPGHWTAWAGTSGLAMIAAQSVTDYPMRNMTMLCVAAMLFVLLLRSSRTHNKSDL